VSILEAPRGLVSPAAPGPKEGTIRVGALDIPASYAVQETGDPSALSFGVAVTPEDRRTRLQIVTEQYLARGYITPEDVVATGGLYVDKYESGAIPLVGKHDGEVVMSLRLIPRTVGLPIASEPAIRQGIYPGFEQVVDQADAEWSGLARKKQSKLRAHDSRPTIGIIRTAFAISEELGFDSEVAVIDEGVMALMNGSRTHFGLPQIGREVFYMGSVSIPIHVDRDRVIESSRKGGKNELADFLKTGSARGYKWYLGK
jgi:hypothetical protein